MTKVKAAVGRVVGALASKEARGAELVLVRLIVAALGIKLGVGFGEWVK